MKPSGILLLIVIGIASVGAQTNTPAPAVTTTDKILTPSQLAPTVDTAPVSASLEIAQHSVATPSMKTKPPLLLPEDSEVFRTKSGLEYRGLVAKALRPPGGKFNPLQLINPFAPASYGVSGPATGSAPRTFRDERTHEPTGFTIISVSR